MREGSLEAPTRHRIAWEDPDFTDRGKTEAEMHRIFDICHTCRRCFNLCDSFPRLFDLIDNSESGELDTVAPAEYQKVADACTLCDMCFMTKCPYVPPHEFSVDFPHVMLRYRAVEQSKGEIPLRQRELVKTDRNGRLASMVAPLANGARKNTLTRQLLEAAAGIDRNAALPKYHGPTFVMRSKRSSPPVDRTAPAYGRNAVLYPTCFVNYNNPSIGEATRAVLARNGVETTVVYPRCCGMPQLEEGNLAAVAEIGEGSRRVSRSMDRQRLRHRRAGPLLRPDAQIRVALDRLGRCCGREAAKTTFDISEYIVDIAWKEGLAPGLSPLDGGVTVQLACHARAQNMGQRAAEMLRLLPQADVAVIERCSGHGGSWGVLKGNFETALKVGRPVARQALKNAKPFLAPECPLAGMHIVQEMEMLADGQSVPGRSMHPIELVARAYGIPGAWSDTEARTS